MANYIDAFTLPIPRAHLNAYKAVANQVAAIWKEHGALSYSEYVGDDLNLAGTRSFPECLNAQTDEAIIFGWVVFESKAARDLANKKVLNDPRMDALVGPLTDPAKMIFDAKRMAFGGFEKLV